MVDNVVTEEKVGSHFTYDFIPKKIESQLTNFIVYDIEAHNTGTAGPFCVSFHRFGNLAAKYD